MSSSCSRYAVLTDDSVRPCLLIICIHTQVEQYHTKLNELADIMAGIHRTYMTPESPNPLNVPPRMSREVRQKMKSIVMTSLPSMETLFGEMKVLVEQLVFTDIYPRFVNHQLALNATKALAKDCTKFQGLGDCFCLTNPRLVQWCMYFGCGQFADARLIARWTTLSSLLPTAS